MGPFFLWGIKLDAKFFIDDFALHEHWVCNCYTMTPLSSGSRYSMVFSGSNVKGGIGSI